MIDESDRGESVRSWYAERSDLGPSQVRTEVSGDI